MLIHPILRAWVAASQTGKNILHYFATANAEKEAYRREMRPLAKKYAEFSRFIITDPSEHSDMLATSSTVDLEASRKIRLALENTETGEMFPFTGSQDITAAAVEAFLKETMKGNLQPRNRGTADEQGKGHDEL